MSIVRLLLLLLYAVVSIQGAKILCIFPYPGPSQYISAEPFFKALAARGHKLTVISHFPQKPKVPNIRDITIKYEGYENLLRATLARDTSTQMAFYSDFFHNATLLVLENPIVQKLLFTKKERFDLVITEVLLTEALYAIAPHLNASLIGFSTYGTDVIIDQWTGNTSPVSYIPLATSDYTDRMNFRQRLMNFIQTAFSWQYLVSTHFEDQRKIYKKYFPHLPHELEDICKNFSVTFLNQHFSLSYPRPYVTNVIEVGGLYIQHNTTQLPDDIKQFIDGAKHGVIYFSMGSNIKSIYIDEKTRGILLKVLGSLKQRVLWKFEDTNLPGKPENVMIKKWFPQPDILAHPNVKLFITHAGLLSTIETIYHAKPIVGIPVFFDQFSNLAHSKRMGFATGVEYFNLTEDGLRAAILEVLNNDSYTKAAQVISRRYHDKPIKPLDLAIYWTEYVLRHNGATHLQVAAKYLNFWQYFSLDVIGFIAVFVMFCFGIFILVVYFTYRFICYLICKHRRESRKPKFQ